jgi:hypothetical protein
MSKPSKPTNFEYLDPEAPRTKRLIDAALTVYVPWEPEQRPVFQRAYIAGPTALISAHRKDSRFI